MYIEIMFPLSIHLNPQKVGYAKNIVGSTWGEVTFQFNIRRVDRLRQRKPTRLDST